VLITEVTIGDFCDAEATVVGLVIYEPGRPDANGDELFDRKMEVCVASSQSNRRSCRLLRIPNVVERPVLSYELLQDYAKVFDQ
jgi:hypothetical protein